MKEATGELNATIVVVVIVVCLAAFFFFGLWPRMKAKYLRDESCANAVCDAGFDPDPANNYMVWCHEPGESGGSFLCPYKG